MKYDYREFLSRYEHYELWPSDFTIQPKDSEIWQSGFEFGPELDSDQVDQFTDLLFEYRNLCWNCARSSIESMMSWKFDLLQYGIKLQEHGAFIETIDSTEETRKWTVVLGWLYKRGVNVSEFADLVTCFNSYGAKPHEIQSICEWVENIFKTAVSREEIEHLLHLGYTTLSEVQHLECDESIVRGILNVPSANALRHLDWDIDSFYHLEKCLELLTASITEEEEFESYVSRLFDTGVSLPDLETILRGLKDDDELSVLDVLYDDGVVDPAGRNIAIGLINTLHSMREAKAPLTEEDLLAYWLLSPSQILHVVDNDIDDFDEILPFRFFENPTDIQRMASLIPLELTVNESYRLTCAGYDATNLEHLNQRGVTNETLLTILNPDNGIRPDELLTWLDFGFSPSNLDEILDWRANQFTPQEAQGWKRENFAPSTAKSWRSNVNDPVIAGRRARAGIRPE